MTHWATITRIHSSVAIAVAFGMRRFVGRGLRPGARTLAGRRPAVWVLAIGRGGHGHATQPSWRRSRRPSRVADGAGDLASAIGHPEPVGIDVHPEDRGTDVDRDPLAGQQPHQRKPARLVERVARASVRLPDFGPARQMRAATDRSAQGPDRPVRGRPPRPHPARVPAPNAFRPRSDGSEPRCRLASHRRKSIGSKSRTAADASTGMPSPEDDSRSRTGHLGRGTDRRSRRLRSMDLANATSRRLG